MQLTGDPTHPGVSRASADGCRTRRPQARLAARHDLAACASQPHPRPACAARRLAMCGVNRHWRQALVGSRLLWNCTQLDLTDAGEKRMAQILDIVAARAEVGQDVGQACAWKCSRHHTAFAGALAACFVHGRAELGAGRPAANQRHSTHLSPAAWRTPLGITAVCRLLQLASQAAAGSLVTSAYMSATPTPDNPSPCRWIHRASVSWS